MKASTLTSVGAVCAVLIMTKVVTQEKMPILFWLFGAVILFTPLVAFYLWHKESVTDSEVKNAGNSKKNSLENKTN